MAWTSNNRSAEFGAGVNYVTADSRSNPASITLGDTASMADQGLDETSQRWDSLSPHAVLATTVAVGSPEDGSWERLQRGAGGYAPGSMETFQD